MPGYLNKHASIILLVWFCLYDTKKYHEKNSLWKEEYIFAFDPRKSSD